MFHSQKIYGCLRINLAVAIVGTTTFWACNSRSARSNISAEPGTATVNLSALTHSSESGVFHEVKRGNLLPSPVLDQLGGIADPAQAFNAQQLMQEQVFS